MKIKAYTLVAALLGAINSVQVLASTIIFDEAEFFHRYVNPTEVIGFTTLKDGTTFSDAESLNSPFLNHTTSTDEFRFRVLENGWSDNFLIRGFVSGGFMTVARWNGTAINVDHSPFVNYRLSILGLNDLTPLALDVISDTYSSFFGIVPDSPTDNHYVLNLSNIQVNKFQAGFSPMSVAKIPSPPGLSLIIGGLSGSTGLENRNPITER